MKYRCLTYQELNIAQAGFIDFLYQNGTNQFEWNLLNDQSHVWASNLLEEYSDMVFDNMLKEIDYIKIMAGNDLLCFELSDQNYTLIRLKIANHQASALMTETMKAEEMTKMKCSISTKKYATSRETLCFELLENGGQVGNGNTFNTLKKMRLIHQN